VAVDGDGNIYIGYTNNERVRKVVAATGLISTIAGTGTIGFNGDGPAGAAELSIPLGLRWTRAEMSISPTRSTSGYAK